MKKIVIIGAGDFGKEVAWLIEDINKISPTYIIAGYLDDDDGKADLSLNGYQYLGKIERIIELRAHHQISAVIAMQDGNIRREIVEKFPSFDRWETLIHPSVHISNTSVLGKGCIVCAGTNISVNTTIGSYCLFNLSVTIGHDCMIGNYVSMMSGSCVCGHVSVGDGAYLATNSTIVPKMKVGSHAKVGAGSVVLRNVRDNVTVMGVPAKILRF